MLSWPGHGYWRLIFGTSLVVWTSPIGIILASLSIGYWWGGRLADRRPESRLLGRIILISAFAKAFVALTDDFAPVDRYVSSRHPLRW